MQVRLTAASAGLTLRYSRLLPASALVATTTPTLATTSSPALPATQAALPATRQGLQAVSLALRMRRIQPHLGPAAATPITTTAILQLA
jgi:hypothetical protein